jgi:hypothetical protein
VKRNGYYGKDKQYVLWRCAGGDGDRPHQIRPELSIRLVGELEGVCEQCERPWEPTDGLPQAVRDRYVLRHKIEALLAMGAVRATGRLVGTRVVPLGARRARDARGPSQPTRG